MYNFGGLAGPAIGGTGMQLVPPHGLPFAFAAITFTFALIAGWRYVVRRNMAGN